MNSSPVRSVVQRIISPLWRVARWLRTCRPGLYRVVCRHIDHDEVAGPVAYGKHGAVDAWNTRADEADRLAVAEKVREAILGAVETETDYTTATPFAHRGRLSQAIRALDLSDLRKEIGDE